MSDTKFLRSKRMALLAVALALCLPSTHSSAKPQVFVTYEVTIVFKDDLVTGLQNVWTFDDKYTAMAVQGLDKNGDGIYDPEELAELAQVNMDGLKEFDHFTYAKFGDAELKFSEPTEAWYEHNDGILRLHFSLPLAKSVSDYADGLKFAIYDPENLIAFEPEQTDAIKLASAPPGCTASLVDSDAGGISAARIVSLSCTKWQKSQKATHELRRSRWQVWFGENALKLDRASKPETDIIRAQLLLTTDPLTGSQLWLPPRVRRESGARSYTGGAGQNYRIGGITVTVFMFDGRSLNDLYATYRSVSGRIIDESQSTRTIDRFSLVGSDVGSTEFTIDVVSQNNEIRGLSIVLSDGKGVTRRQMRSLSRKIRNSYVPFPAASGGPIGVGSAAPQGTSEAAGTNVSIETEAVAQQQLEPPIQPRPAPSTWSVPQRSTDGRFDEYRGADITGNILLQTRSNANYSLEKCANACLGAPKCAAFTRYSDGRCIMRLQKGDVLEANLPGTVSGVRVP